VLWGLFRVSVIGLIVALHKHERGTYVFCRKLAHGRLHLQYGLQGEIVPILKIEGVLLAETPSPERTIVPDGTGTPSTNPLGFA